MSVKQLGPRENAELLGVSSRSKLFAYGTLAVLGGIRVNTYLIGSIYNHGEQKKNIPYNSHPEENTI